MRGLDLVGIQPVAGGVVKLLLQRLYSRQGEEKARGVSGRRSLWRMAAGSPHGRFPAWCCMGLHGGHMRLTSGVRTVEMVGLNEMAEKNLLKSTRTPSGLYLSTSSLMVEA